MVALRQREVLDAVKSHQPPTREGIVEIILQMLTTSDRQLPDSSLREREALCN